MKKIENYNVNAILTNQMQMDIQKNIPEDMRVEFVNLTKLSDTEYAEQVAELALRDKFAHRASRKKFQSKPCVIMKVNDEFAGFFIYEENNKDKQFYLWQLGIDAPYKGYKLSKLLVAEALKNNVKEYPACVSIYEKNEVSRGLFEQFDFKPYAKKSGIIKFCRGGYVDGIKVEASDFSRVKALVGITPTNVWNSMKGEWLVEKKKWNELIDNAGIIANVDNPAYATREGCWQGENGYSTMMTGKNHNDGASVLDPFACEICLKLFMRKDGKRVYNPFGGGIQFGFVTGFYGYEYIASEIRQNQCDANNAICGAYQMDKVKWVQSDSSTYEPEGMFDLIFTCPPYYKVERYIDYDGNPPSGEINDMATYEEFRDTLFKGYQKAIEHLNENSFFVAMVGDSRDKNGAYYGMEAETELFLKSQGLHLYNKIIYLETAFTRAMQVGKTIDSRKLPKQEQKIIVAYKGNLNNIKALFEPIGRL